MYRTAESVAELVEDRGAAGAAGAAIAAEAEDDDVAAIACVEMVVKSRKGNVGGCEVFRSRKEAAFWR